MSNKQTALEHSLQSYEDLLRGELDEGNICSDILDSWEIYRSNIATLLNNSVDAIVKALEGNEDYFDDEENQSIEDALNIITIIAKERKDNVQD